MNFSSLVVLAIVGILLFLAIRSIVHGNAGDCSGCNGDCAASGCTSCSVAEKMLVDMERADREAKRAQAEVKDLKV